MKRFYLEIEASGAAFESDVGDVGDDEASSAEIARILEAAARDVRSGADSVVLRDALGNTVGLASYVWGA